jgi:hypothetical protein
MEKNEMVEPVHIPVGLRELFLLNQRTFFTYILYAVAIANDLFLLLL